MTVKFDPILETEDGLQTESSGEGISDVIITQTGTTSADFLTAYKSVLATNVVDGKTITWQFGSSVFQAPSADDSEGYNTGLGYTINKRKVIIQGASVSSAVTGVSVSGALGAATLTFSAPLPTQAFVGSNVQFVTGNTSGWTTEGLAGAWEISAIDVTNPSAPVVTILTPGVTLPTQAGSATKRVIFVPSTIYGNSPYGEALFNPDGVEVTFTDIALRFNGTDSISQQGAAIYCTNGGGVKRGGLHIQNVYTGIWLNVGSRDYKTGNSCSFTNCSQGIYGNMATVVDGGTGTGRTQFVGCINAIVGDNKCEFNFNLPEVHLTISTGHPVTSNTSSVITIVDTPRIFTKTSGDGYTYFVTGGKIFATVLVSTTLKANIIVNQSQIDGSYVGSNTEQASVTSTSAATSSLTLSSRSVLITGTGTTLTLPQVYAINGKYTGSLSDVCVYNIFNNGSGTVNITPTVNLINGAVTYTLLSGQSCVIRSMNGNWYV